MPAFATAHYNAALAIRSAALKLWTSFRTTHRDISTSLAVSAAFHAVALLAIGSALYVTGEDEVDVPELSVQLITRAGPNSEELTDAALPMPAPEPVEEVIEDPGMSSETLVADTPGDSIPLEHQVPDQAELAPPEAQPLAIHNPAAVLTTSGSAETEVPLVPEAVPPEPVSMSQPEQTMLQKNVQQLAQQLLDTNMTNTELSWSQEGRQYTARVTRQPAADSTGLEQVIAEIMTENNGKRMRTKLSLKRLAFSHFTQLVNNWDPSIRLHDDVIDGRFHSNTEIGLAFSKGVEPRFFGKVTTAAAKMTFDGGGANRRRNHEVFQGGIETRTERVALPREMPDVVGGGEDSDRQLFTDDTRIIFNADGSYVWRHANGEGALQRAEASERPRFLIGQKGAKLYVRGTVCGIFTVYSPNDIEIEDDVTYSRDPRDTLISRDFLALIAGRDITISPPQITGAGDLHVHGALYAKRRFAIESVDRSKPGTLHIFGSLTAGTIWETEPRYATKMDYDKRFEYLRPAAFPMTRRYEVDSWDGDWKEVE